jgi:inositol 3-alpha-galactosyltransferase
VDASRYVRSLYAECWAKLRMWEWQGEFERLIYLDADMLVLKNIDHLFDLPPAPLYAVGDCYGGREDAEEREACCHFAPDTQPAYFNAGFLVIAPSRAELAGMAAALAAGAVGVGRFAEQDFLNGYFAGRWSHLPYVYNAQKCIKFHHPQLWCLPQVAVLHFVDEKPWSHRHSAENQAYRELCDLWWSMSEGEAASPGAGRGEKAPPALCAPGRGAAGAGTVRVQAA